MDGRPSYVVFPLSLNNSAPPILLVRLFLLLGGDPDRVHPSAVIEASNVRLIPTPFHMASSPPRDVEGSAIGVLSVVPSVVQVVGVSHRARDQNLTGLLAILNRRLVRTAGELRLYWSA